MSTAYVIEVHGFTAGIVARDQDRFHFYASSSQFNALEGAAFTSPRAAERAARRIIEGRDVARRAGRPS